MKRFNLIGLKVFEPVKTHLKVQNVKGSNLVSPLLWKWCKNLGILEVVRIVKKVHSKQSFLIEFHFKGSN